MPYCSLLESVAVYNFTEIESIFPVPFYGYVADCFEITWPNVYGPVTWFPFVWWGKISRTDSSTKDFSLIGSLFFYICCSLSVAQNTLPRQHIFYSEICFFISCSLLVLQHLIIFVTVINLILQPFSQSSQENFINFVMWFLACMV